MVPTCVQELQELLNRVITYFEVLGFFWVKIKNLLVKDHEASCFV